MKPLQERTPGVLTLRRHERVHKRSGRLNKLPIFLFCSCKFGLGLLVDLRQACELVEGLLLLLLMLAAITRRKFPVNQGKQKNTSYS